jgi:uncharacterized integral membrane protein
MNKLTNFLIGIIFTIFLVIFAVFSIQNITEISLKFFFLESIKLPVGIMLCCTFGLGIIFGSILPLLLPTNRQTEKPQSRPLFRRGLQEDEKDPLFDWE